MPVALGGWIALLRRPERPLPPAAENGTGDPVLLALPERDGEQRIVSVRKMVKTDAAWRRELSPSEFAVSRRAATELAFSNRYWHTKTPGIYYCTCCGNALFLSRDKFDSGTGWPSFSTPFATQNVYTRNDASLAVARTEVLCRKCDAHLGHVFDDGPSPSNLRYCLNSAALRLVAS